MPTVSLTPAEAVLLRWLRAEIRRLASDPDDQNCAVLILGHPDENTMLFIHQLTEHCPDVTEIGDGQSLIDEGPFCAYGTQLA